MSLPHRQIARPVPVPPAPVRCLPPILPVEARQPDELHRLRFHRIGVPLDFTCEPGSRSNAACVSTNVGSSSPGGISTTTHESSPLAGSPSVRCAIRRLPASPLGVPSPSRCTHCAPAPVAWRTPAARVVSGLFHTRPRAPTSGTGTPQRGGIPNGADQRRRAQGDRALFSHLSRTGARAGPAPNTPSRPARFAIFHG